ncbi:MAG TPA: ATP-binding protein [bacterium]|nr:ATP-binding protein [bacterium]
MVRERVLVSWSGGKDSCLALDTLLADGTRDVVALLTTITEGFDRVSMHGVRLDVVRRQADALRFPLEVAIIPQQATNAAYEACMEPALARHRGLGVRTIAFGDLFLDEVRGYRERWLAGTGMTPVFPIWHRDTRALARRFIDDGFEAILTCVDTRVLAPSFAGRAFDHALLADLPAAVDPCGENGEFHTFVWNGPRFHRPVPVVRGEVVRRDAWCFCDLVPA